MAGDAAARLFAHAEAEAHYRTALDVARRTGVETERLRSLYERRGTALEISGRHGDAIANYEEQRDAGRATGDERMTLAANIAIALLYSTASSVTDPERGLALSRENLSTARRIGDRAAEGRALWNILVANVYGGDAGVAIEAGEGAIAIAREVGDPEPLAFMLQDVARAHLSAGDLATAIERLEEARGLWERVGNRAMLGDNLTVTGELCLMQGDLEGGIDRSRRGAAIAEEIDNAWGQSHALMGVYLAQFLVGQVGPGIETLLRSRELGERGGFAYAGIATRAELAGAYVSLGDPVRALSEADGALDYAVERLPSAAPAAQAARAEALLASGERERARAALDEIVDVEFPEPERSYALARAGLARSRLALADGDATGAASAAAEILERLRSRWIRPFVPEALLALARARIGEGRVHDAETSLTDAIAEAEELEARMALWEALALRARLLDGRDADEAAELRRRANAIVEEIAGSFDDGDLHTRFLARATAELSPSPSAS
jgi:tetratricopeptide (TPR) repeat protein